MLQCRCTSLHSSRISKGLSAVSNATQIIATLARYRADSASTTSGKPCSTMRFYDVLACALLALPNLMVCRPCCCQLDVGCLPLHDLLPGDSAGDTATMAPSATARALWVCRALRWLSACARLRNPPPRMAGTSLQWQTKMLLLSGRLSQAGATSQF